MSVAPAPYTRLVVFDLDGTLVDSRGDIVDAVNAALVEAGLSPRTDAEIETMVGEGARHLVERAIGGRLPPERTDGILARYGAFYRLRPTARTVLYPGVREGLERLSRVPGLSRIVATNKPGDLARTVVSELGLAPLFDAVLGDGDVPHRKPHPAMLNAAMERAGVARHATVYVGDGPIDTRTAHEAGVPLCLVDWGYRKGESLPHEPTLRARTFDEVERFARG